MERRQASKALFIMVGEKVPLVGVGDTTEMSHFEIMANISSASLSSCGDSRSCCASVGRRDRRLGHAVREGKRFSCCGASGDKSSQTLVVLPSGICIETQKGSM
jgi:hypothetical protein